MPGGERFGTYEVIDRLSRGGMGVVWRAQGSGVEVAVKTVEAADEGMLRAIRAEIRALERVRHPGVVRILAHGVRDGLPWYAMELLRGATLRSVLSELHGHPTEEAPSTFPPQVGEAGAPSSEPEPAPVPAALGQLPRILGLFRALCEALAWLHGEGVVHRDLKPENLFVRPDGTPVLVDFGMAQSGAGAGASRESLDALALGGGTVSYMAPEQALGDLVDARADLYAVGVMLFEALCGRPPFSGSRSAVVFAKIGQRAPSIDRYATGVPRALARLLDELLHPDPTSRTAHARVVVGVLDALGAPRLPGGPGGEPRPYLYRPVFQPPKATVDLLLARCQGVTARAGARVHLRGEPGSGKTRLAVEVAQTLRQSGFQPLSCPCVPAPGSRTAAPLDPLRPVLRALHDRVLSEGDRGDDPVLALHGPLLARWAPELRELPSVAAGGEPPELRPDTERVRLYEALVAAIRRYVEHTPTVLVLDDLPFADELTLGFLAVLRDEDLPHVALITTGLGPGPGGAETLAVPALTEVQVRAMVAAMCGSTDAPPSLVQAVAARAAGNPFVVAELLREAIRVGVLDRDPRGAWVLREVRLDALQLPATVAELVDHRLATVPPAAEPALRWAAVIGSGSEESLLSLRADPESVDALVRAEVLGFDASGRLRFASPTLAEVVHGRFGDAERRDLHRAAAEALQPARPGRHGRIARHLREAEDPGAFEASLLAGEEALVAIAFERAVTELSHAEALLPPTTPAEARTRLHLRLGRAWWGAGHAARSREAFAVALAEAGDPRPERSVGAIAWILWAVLAELFRVARPDRSVEPPPAEAEQRALLAEAHRYLVYLDILRNEPLGSITSALRASAHGWRGGRRARRASDLATLGVMAGFAGARWLSDRYFDRAEARLRRSGDRHDEVLVALARASLALGYARWDEVHRFVDRGEEAAAAVGDAEQLAVLRQLRCTALQLSGRVDEAVRRCDEVIASSRSQMPRLWARCVLVDALTSLGRSERALAEARMVLAELGDQSEDHATRSNALAVLATLQLDGGLEAEARLTAGQATMLCRQGSEEAFAVFPYHVHTPAVWLRLWERHPEDAGLRAEAERAVEGARRYAARYPIGRSPAERHRAVLLVLQGRVDEARAALAAAREAGVALGMIEQTELSELEGLRLVPAAARAEAAARVAARLRELGFQRAARASTDQRGAA